MLSRKFTRPIYYPMANAIHGPGRSPGGGFPGGGIVFPVEYLQKLFYTSPAIGADGKTVLGQNNEGGDYRPIQPGRALTFDGSTQWVEATTPFSSGDPISVSIWIRRTNATNLNARLIDFQHNGLDIRMSGTGIEIQARIGPSKTLVSGFNTTQDEWTHVVLTHTGTDGELFINGDSKVTGSDTGYSTDGTFRIGKGKFVSGLANGQTADVQIFGRVLTPAEITTIYQQGINPHKKIVTPTDYIGRWNLDNIGSTQYDSSGNNNHGTVQSYAAGMQYESKDVPFSSQNVDGLSQYSYMTPSNGVEVQHLGADADDTNEVSIGMWVYMPSFINDGHLFNLRKTGSNNSLWLKALNGQFEFTLNYSTGLKQVQSQAGITAGVIYFVVATAKPDGNVEITANGEKTIGFAVESNATGDWSNPANTTVNTCIGYGGPDQIDPDAIVWGVRYYDRAITDQEIADWRNGSPPANPRNVWDKLTWNDSVGGKNVVTNNSSIVPVPVAGSTDVFDQPIDYTGLVPKYGELKQSPCMSFNGTNQLINCGNNYGFSNPDKPFRISARVNVGAVPGGILGKSSKEGVEAEYVITITASSEVQCILYGPTTAESIRSRTEPVISVGEDTLIEASYDGSGTADGINIYINGALVNQTKEADNVYTGMESTVWPFNIGATLPDSETYSNWLNGSICDVKIYDDEAGNNLIGYFPLAEGNGSTLYDVSGNDNHATQSNYDASPGTGSWSTKQDEFHYNCVNGVGKKSFDFAGWFNGTTAPGNKQHSFSAFRYSGTFKQGLTDGATYRIKFHFNCPQGMFNLYLGTSGSTPALVCHLGPEPPAGNPSVPVYTQIEGDVDLLFTHPTGENTEFVIRANSESNQQCIGTFTVDDWILQQVDGPAIPAVNATHDARGFLITGPPDSFNNDVTQLDTTGGAGTLPPFQRIAIGGATTGSTQATLIKQNTSDLPRFNFDDDWIMRLTFRRVAGTGGHIGTFQTQEHGIRGAGELNFGGFVDGVNAWRTNFPSIPVSTWVIYEVRWRAATTTVEVKVTNLITGEIISEGSRVLTGVNASSNPDHLRLILGARRYNSLVEPSAGDVYKNFGYNHATLGNFKWDFSKGYGRSGNQLIFPCETNTNANADYIMDDSSSAFSIIPFEQDYSKGSGRTVPHYVEMSEPEDKQFRTEI